MVSFQSIMTTDHAVVMNSTIVPHIGDDILFQEPSCPFALSRVEVSEFPFGNKIIRLKPSLTFPLVLDQGIWEVRGEDLFASVLVQASDMFDAINELRTDVLPFLWRQYALEDDARLDQEARGLKADLLRRAHG